MNEAVSIGVLVSAALTFAAAMVISWGIIAPFFQREHLGEGVGFDEQQRVDAFARRERLVRALEDLEQARLAGTLAEEEYQRSKEELTAEAVQCFAQCEALMAAQTAAGKTARQRANT